jgi:hypothetical protein
VRGGLFWLHLDTCTLRGGGRKFIRGGPVKFFALLQTVREGRSTKIHDFKGLLAKKLGGIYKNFGC